MFAIVADVQLDNSYPTGGYALTPQAFGLTTFDFVLPAPRNGYVVEYNPTTGKLLLWNNLTEVANATNVSTIKVRLLAMGT